MPNIKIPSGVRHGVEVDVHTPPMPPIALPSAHHVSICAGMTYHYVSMRRTLEHSQASPRDAGACRAEWSAYTRPRLMSAWTIKYFFWQVEYRNSHPQSLVGAQVADSEATHTQSCKSRALPTCLPDINTVSDFLRINDCLQPRRHTIYQPV